MNHFHEVEPGKENKSRKKYDLPFIVGMIAFAVIVALAGRTGERSQLSEMVAETRAMVQESSDLQKELEQSQRLMQAAQQEAEQAKSELEFVRIVLTATDSAVVGLNREGDITFWSDGAVDFFGYDRQEVIGYKIAFLLPADMRGHHKQVFDKSMQRDEPFHREVECEAVHKNKSLVKTKINIWGKPSVGSVAVFTHSEIVR